MEFEELNENELFRIKGGEDNSLFYQIGWWLAERFKYRDNIGSSGGHF